MQVNTNFIKTRLYSIQTHKNHAEFGRVVSNFASPTYISTDNIEVMGERMKMFSFLFLIMDDNSSIATGVFIQDAKMQ